MSTKSVIFHQNQATAEWVKLFPRSVVNSYTNSVTFMKQLTVIAISTILYLKDLFSENNYKLEDFGGLKIRILKKECDNEMAQFLSTSLIQAFEAFDKQCLQQLALCFYNGPYNSENLVEYHIFEYTYNPAGVTIDVHSKTLDRSPQSARYTFDNIREKTLNLIRTCILMAHTTEKMDSSITDISLRLYYNDNAPEEYQAPGFLPTPDTEDHLAGKVSTVNPHSVETPYHRLKMHSFTKNLMPDIEEAIVSPTARKMSHDKCHETDVSRSGSGVPKNSKPILQCLCNMSDAEVFDTKLFIMCSYCTTYQHRICYGIFRSDVSPVVYHCCATCHDQEPRRIPTDITLVKIGARKRESLSVVRRTLDWCSQVQTVSASDLVDRMRISEHSATNLMKMLQGWGIFAYDPEANLTTQRKIIPEELKKAIQKHFQTGKHNIVERLLAESLSQQQLDPVGDKLEPIERTDLNNATTLGRLVEADPPTNTVEDATLKQYREAIILDQKFGDKLPLSGTHNPIKGIEDIGKQGVKRNSDMSMKTRSKTKKLKSTSK